MKYPFKLCVLLAGLAAAAFAATPDYRVPSLNDPATTESRPGKFLWVDLFTADAAASTKFYADLFGWEWKTLGTGAQTYQIAYHLGVPVAGAVQHPQAKGEAARARWIGYISVADVAATVKKVQDLGGRLLLAPRQVPDRGQLAILADPEGALFGVLQSSSGDPADYRPEAGEWNWAQLFAGDDVKAAAFYQSVFGYEVQTGPGSTYLSSGGIARAGLSKLPADAKHKPAWLGFIAVTNMAETLAKAKTLGGTVIVEPRTTPGGAEVAIIADSVGAAVGLVTLDNLSTGEK